jgi:hypothetical protein
MRAAALRSYQNSSGTFVTQTTIKKPEAKVIKRSLSNIDADSELAESESSELEPIPEGRTSMITPGFIDGMHLMHIRSALNFKQIILGDDQKRQAKIKMEYFVRKWL